MKKSIFLFFAAILCAMTANAACYLKGGFNDWSTANEMAVSGTTATCTIDLAGSTTFEFKVNNGSSWHGSSSTVTSTATTITLNGGDNAKITTTIPGTYTFSFNTSSKQLTVTYPTVPAPHDITVRAQVPASWTNTITAWVWTSENGTGEEVTPTKDGDYYVVTKNAGALYVIFKNGAGWNGDKNQTIDLCYTEDVCLQLNQSGDAKATATVIECGAIAKDITVKAVVPGAWENTITAWVWPTGGEGKEVTPTKDGNWYVVTENCIELNVIFKNGTGWNGKENQTANITGVSENTCYQISALNKDGEGKCTYTVVDCEAAIEPEEKPAPTPTYDYYVVGSFNSWTNPDPAHGMTLDGEVYKATVTLAEGENLVKVTNGTWTDAKGFSAMGAEYEEVSAGASDDNIMVTLAAGKDVVVVYNATTKKVTFEGLTEKAPAPTYDYYICGSFNSNNPKNADNGMTLDGEVYKATVTLAEGDNTLKVTDGTWDKTWGANELGAAYDEVSNPNDYNNIKITLAAEKTITVIFDATAGKITFEGLTEKAPAEPVTVYFINSGNWAEVACYYWGGIESSTWPGAQMTANGEVYEAEGWNVYAITFPGDNTKCIFTDNKAEGTTQTADLEVQNGKYYCYANGIWYERLADVDPLDTRVYLKGDMNEWCATEGWCDMFRKEDVSENVAYRTTRLEAETTYEFKIEDAGTWLSNEGTMDKDNCTGWEFTEGANNAKITTEYAGDYTFVWDMTTKKLSVVYPELVPTVMDLVVTNMVFDGDNMTFSGSDNTYSIAFNLVVGEEIEAGVFALDASSTVDFEGMPFTDVTGMIAPDMSMGMPTAATAVVYGFLGGSEYFQFNLNMSAGGSAGVPVEILDGTASVNDATGELTISGNWDGDDVYVVAPGFNGVTYDCDEVWFYVGGTTWETASIIAFGPATITVDGNDVQVEGTVMSGATGTNYDLFVIGTFPAAVTTIDVTLSGMVATPISRMGRYSYLSLDDEDGNQISIFNGTEGAYGEDFEVNAYLADYDVTVVGNGTWAVVDGVETLTATLQVEDDNTTIYNVTATVGVATTITLECYNATYTITDPEFNEVTFTGIADGKEFTILVSYFGGEYYSEGEWDGTPILGTSVEFDDSDAEEYYLGGTYIDDANNTYEVAIFGAPAAVEPTPDYTRTVTNKYGTICLPNAAASTTGAIFYRVAGKEEGKVYLESVDALEAGVPYIFEATASTITVTYQGEAVAEAGTANGLVGTFVETTVPDGDYILYNNAFCTNEPAGTLNKIKENRAYLDMDAVTGDAPQQMPGRRYIGMSVQGENAETGLENIIVPEGQAVKVISNGQLIIIRDGEMYNAQGQRL